MVSKMDRGELEDKFIRLYEENLIIKRYAKKQDDKIKKLVECYVMLHLLLLWEGVVSAKPIVVNCVHIIVSG